MKKFLKVVGILLLLIVVAAIAIPIVFKDKIITEIQNQANANLNADLSFSDAGLSLFSNFPNLTLTIDDLDLQNQTPFEGVHLVKANEISATIDLASVFGSSIKVKDVQLDQPVIDIRVLPDGTANYDIAKANENEPEENTEETESGEGFNMALEQYGITNGTVHYVDETFPMELHLETFNHTGSGDFTASAFDLQTLTEAASATFGYDGINYLNKAKLTADVGFNIDTENSKYTLRENSVKVNDFGLHADGYVALPAEYVEMDINFEAEENTFKSILSLVPADFAKDLEGVDASGVVGFDGFVRGKYNEFNLPGLLLNLTIEDGSLQYPDLPESVENVQLDAHLDARNGIDKDDLKLDINTLHLEMAGAPIDAQLKVRTPYTDPGMEGRLVAKVVLENIKKAIPLPETDELAGTINADVTLAGNYSAIQEERYRDFNADGQIIIQQLRYASDSLDYDVDIDKAYLNFSPQAMELANLVAQVGNSDFKANGEIDNYLGYFLNDELLHGDFNLTSDVLDLNAFMTADEDIAEEQEMEEGTEEPMGVVRLPENIDFTLNSQIGKLIYDDYDISELSGEVTLKEAVAGMRNVEMNMLGGKITADGFYDSAKTDPFMDMDFGIQNMDIQKAATAFYTIEKLAPIAKSCVGKFSTTMNLSTALNQNMEPIFETLSGAGRMLANSVMVEKFEPLNKLAQELKIDRLSKQRFEDLNISYRFENGRVIVDPFEVNLDGVPATIDGSMGFDQSLDYKVKMDLPMSKLPGNIGSQTSGLLGQLNDALGTSVSTAASIPVSIRIKGTMDDPKIAGDYGDVVKEATQDVKEQAVEAVKEEINQQIDTAKEDAIAKAKEEADQIMAEAQAQADQIMETARREAEELRSAGYAEADKLENKGANFIEKAANKKLAEAARKETDKRVDKAIAEAQKRADNVVATAQERADAVIAKAEEK